MLFDDFDRIGRATRSRPIRASRIASIRSSRCAALSACDFAGTAPDPITALRPRLVPAPDEELGFRTAGWPERQEELGLHLRGSGGPIELGLYRERARHAAPAEVRTSTGALL